MHCRSCRRLRRRCVSKDRFRSLRQLLQVCGARHQSCGTQLVGERAGRFDRDLSFVRPHSRMNSLPQGYVNSLQGLGQTQVCAGLRCCRGVSPVTHPLGANSFAKGPVDSTEICRLYGRIREQGGAPPRSLPQVMTKPVGGKHHTGLI